MLVLLPFLALLLPFYVFVLITHFIGGIFGVLFGITFLEELYIKLLLKVFSYAASTVTDGDSINDKKNLLDRKMSISNYDRDLSLIDRDIRLDLDGMKLNRYYADDPNNNFDLSNPTYFVKSGVEAVIEDDVTKRFSSNELKVWNLLSRTHSYQHFNHQLTIIWALGMFSRYVILLPCRFIFATLSIMMLVLLGFIIGLFPEKQARTINAVVSKVAFRLFIRAFCGVIRFHNKENRPKTGGICVANHTTPIDVIVLSCDNGYAMVGQKQGGFFGIIQKIFGKVTSTIWFERCEAKDRGEVTKRLKQHVNEPGTWPILIFPEGTCINNTSVMMFKKGSFEVGGVIHPVAIKYDRRFSDCFWNSGKFSFVQYLIMMMTSWAIVADVWYMPPEYIEEGENSIAFANRVKRRIAERGGLVDMKWDGGLKRALPKDSLKQVQQESFTKLIKPTLE